MVKDSRPVQIVHGFRVRNGIDAEGLERLLCDQRAVVDFGLTGQYNLEVFTCLTDASSEILGRYAAVGRGILSAADKSLGVTLRETAVQGVVQIKKYSFAFHRSSFL